MARTAAAAAALALVALPTSADAGTAGVAGRRSRPLHREAPSERNDVTVTADDGVITLVDAGAPTIAGEGCAGGGTAELRFPARFQARSYSSLWSLGMRRTPDDRTRSGRRGQGGSEAGRGSDLMRGGEGADTVVPGKRCRPRLGGGGNDSWAQYGGRPDGSDYFEGERVTIWPSTTRAIRCGWKSTDAPTTAAPESTTT